MFDCFHKTLPINTFQILLVKILYLEKKACNMYTCKLEFTFLREDVIDKKQGEWTGKGCNNKE